MERPFALSCGFSQSTDQTVATAALGLGPPRNNGGPTETMLPATTGPADGAIPTGTTLWGVQVCPRTDQRGVGRPGSPADTRTPPRKMS